MKYPMRADFADGASYIAGMDAWMKASDEAYQRLRGLYDTTEASSTKPEWLAEFVQGRGTTIRSVQVNTPPDSEENLEARLNMLSTNALETGLKVTNLCHGVLDGVWACYVELK